MSEIFKKIIAKGNAWSVVPDIECVLQDVVIEMTIEETNIQDSGIVTLRACAASTTLGTTTLMPLGRVMGDIVFTHDDDTTREEFIEKHAVLIAHTLLSTTSVGDNGQVEIHDGFIVSEIEDAEASSGLRMMLPPKVGRIGYFDVMLGSPEASEDRASPFADKVTPFIVLTNIASGSDYRSRINLIMVGEQGANQVREVWYDGLGIYFSESTDRRDERVTAVSYAPFARPFHPQERMGLYLGHKRPENFFRCAEQMKPAPSYGWSSSDRDYKSNLRPHPITATKIAVSPQAMMRAISSIRYVQISSDWVIMADTDMSSLGSALSDIVNYSGAPAEIRCGMLTAVIRALTTGEYRKSPSAQQKIAAVNLSSDMTGMFGFMAKFPDPGATITRATFQMEAEAIASAVYTIKSSQNQ